MSLSWTVPFRCAKHRDRSMISMVPSIKKCKRKKFPGNSRWNKIFVSKHIPFCKTQSSSNLVIAHQTSWAVKTINAPENTHLLCKWKNHCTADLLFDRLGVGQTSKSVYSFNSTKQLNPNQSNRTSAVQWYFPLRSKWVFSGRRMPKWRMQLN